MEREQLGRIVRNAWVAYCIETGDTKPSHIAPWEELSEWDKEADRRIADAVKSALLPDLTWAPKVGDRVRYMDASGVPGTVRRLFDDCPGLVEIDWDDESIECWHIRDLVLLESDGQCLSCGEPDAMERRDVLSFSVSEPWMRCRSCGHMEDA